MGGARQGSHQQAGGDQIGARSGGPNLGRNWLVAFPWKKVRHLLGVQKRKHGGNPFGGSEINPFTFWGNGGNPESGLHGRSLVEAPKRPRHLANVHPQQVKRFMAVRHISQRLQSVQRGPSKLNPFRLGRREMEETLKVAAM